MATQDVEIKPTLKVTLKPDTQMVDEIVIVGYGSGKKLGSVVGSVSTVSNTKLKNQPTANFTDALQGQVSGLSVLSESGEPSKSATIRLRGVNSITAGTTPLFILDGAPITSAVFNSLNPGDIENITVLKDASSTAIYGSRAANGVIVITSKKGRMGQKARVTIRGQYGISNLIDDKVDMLNSQQYMAFREMIDPTLVNNAEWITHKDVVTKNNIDTDWTDYSFKSNAPVYQVDASVTGGGTNTNYYLSLSHMDMEGIEPMSGLRRESLRSNIEARVNDWMKIGLNSNLGFSKYRQNPEAAESDIYDTNPSVFSRMSRPDDSPYYYTVDENGIATFGDRADKLHYTQSLNPYYVNEFRQSIRTSVNANLNLYEELTPIKGLTIRAAQALDAFDYTYSGVTDPVPTFTTPMGDDIVINDGKGSRSELFQRLYNFTYTNTAEYKFDINNDHFISVLIGQESIIRKNNYFQVARSGMTDVRLMFLQNGTEEPTATQKIEESVFNSYFAHADYNYKEKYYIDLSFRGDGSSKFAPDNRWANFWSVGGKWDIKKESFMDDLNWMDELSLRASYGTTGNSSIDDYMFYGLIGGGAVYNGESGTGISRPSNSDLTWETVTAANLGLNFRIFDRLSVGAEFYHKKTTDMLMQIPYSYTTGFGAGYGNIGAMTNVGVDLDVALDIINNSAITWIFKANANYNKNEITELFNGTDEYVLPGTGLKLQVGKPYGEFYSVERIGIDPRDGKQIWLDKNGNPTKTYNVEADSRFTGKQSYAPWSGGFGTSFMWKGLTVSADCSWALGKYAMNNDRYFFENVKEFGSTNNQSVTVLDTWREPGQITDIPAAGEQLQFDTHLLENASFLRLKNVTISYALPQRWLKKTKLVEGLNIFAIGRNLLTATKFSGYDPEPDINVIKFNYPNTKQFVFGCEITF